MVDNRNAKIYSLKHPDTLEIVYVGKTVVKLNRRLANHIANAKGDKHNKQLSNWILNLLSENKRPIIELIEECDESIWESREMFWISQYSNLMNLTKGGNGSLGYIHDDEAKLKCGLSNLGRTHSDSFKQNMSRRLKGVKLKPEHVSKISAGNKGKKASEETKLKLSESHKGIIQSEETKRKRSETIKAWWAARKSIEDIVKS